MTPRLGRRSGGRAADVLQIASLLLQYPDAELAHARTAIADTLAAMPDSPQRRALQRFTTWSAGRTAIEVEREYVKTFDTARRRSLYLTHPLHGDRRERGSALLLLKRRYAANGFHLESTELPDFLPVMLEYAARCDEGGALLAEHRAALELLHDGLRDAASPWVDVVAAVRACLPRLTRAQLAAVRRLAAEGPPGELVGLEPFAPPEFMPNAAGQARR
jgi:nitrate reductase molybdenum cofactor assembly chaperone NarJ/NarW